MKAMIGLYCEAHHEGSPLCVKCRALEQYAEARLLNCPFGEGKTVCNLCPVHCYKQDRREEIRQVMRYAGPRMLLRHPYLTLMHFHDKRRQDPVEMFQPETEQS